MKKINQYFIFRFETDRLKDANYKIKNITLDEARKNGEVVSISDSEMVRTLHRITNKKFSQFQLNELIDIKIKLSKKNNTKEQRKLLENTLLEIDDLLFIPEIISLKISDKRHYQNILNHGGFTVNGKKYVPFIFSAGLIRRNSGLFIQEDLKDQLIEIFDNGRNKEIEIVPAKYNSYLSLVSSSTLPVTFPRIVIVPDLILKKLKKVDYGSYQGEGVDPLVEEKELELEFNAFDGCGMVSPHMAKQWSADLELDYVGSTFGVRCSFLKGMCVTFDFHKFAEEVSESYIVKDIYGRETDIRNIDVIVSPSMFKLSEAYESTEDYTTKCFNNKVSWGISKVNPKSEKSFCKTSYQFLQVLNLSDEQISNLCKPTVDWISNVNGLDLESTILYSLGSNLNFESKWFDKLEPIYKSLFLENELIKDSYLITHLDKSLTKKKNDAKKGNLFLKGNYQAAIPDLYLYCKHIFGMNTEPFLKEGEFYSHYWNEQGVSEVVGVRSPIVFQSEIILLNFRKDDEVRKWFSHIKSGIILPANGISMDFALAGGMDSDYDLLCTIQSEEMVQGRTGGLPVVYDTEKANKGIINKDTEFLLHQAQMTGFGTKVGFFTNVSSTLYSLLESYGKDSLEHNIILNRLKWGRAAQGLEIDRQKGLTIPAFPEHWTKYKKIKDDMSDDEKSKTELNNRLLADKRPYFFIYLYSHYRKRYLKELSVYNNISLTKYNISFADLLLKSNRSEEQEALIEQYRKRSYFINNNSVMNKLSRHMEMSLDNLKISKSELSRKFNYEYLLSSQFKKPVKRDLDKLNLLFKEYKSLRRNLASSYDEFEDNDFSSVEQIYKYINKKAHTTINSNSSELADIVVYLCYKVMGKQSKSFAWNCFGNEIFQNIRDRRTQKFVRVPLPDPKGKIEYLFDRYSVHLINIEE